MNSMISYHWIYISLTINLYLQWLRTCLDKLNSLNHGIRCVFSSSTAVEWSKEIAVLCSSVILSKSCLSYQLIKVILRKKAKTKVKKWNGARISDFSPGAISCTRNFATDTVVLCLKEVGWNTHVCAAGPIYVPSRAQRVLDTWLQLRIFCPTRTRLGPNTTRTE